MQICIVGGGLQGLEASYLSKKLGWRTVLIDRKPNPPAKEMADEFHKLDLLNEKDDVLKEVLENSDAILPATENVETLTKLELLSKKFNLPFLQDNRAFLISRDKKETERLFDILQIPHPKSFSVNCESLKFPLILKPSLESGSTDVTLVRNRIELREALSKLSQIYGDNIIIQEYVNGLALSLEVIGDGELHYPILTTCLEFDSQFSCKRVYTPENMEDLVESRYFEDSIKIARALRLKGLMDTQAIVEGSTPFMIEINARLPSQTPTVVYNSTDINFIEVLYEVFALNRLPRLKVTKKRAVMYQHVEIKDGNLFIRGERIIKGYKGLRLEPDFFGVEAITNLQDYNDYKDSIEGVATLIVKARSLAEAKKRMKEVLIRILEEFSLRKIIDETPPKV